MKRINFNRKAYPKPQKYTGYLFNCMGLQLVVYKPYINAKWWYVCEFRTGFGLGQIGRTKKESIDSTKEFLKRQGSVTICKVMNTVICEHGFLNK